MIRHLQAFVGLVALLALMLVTSCAGEGTGTEAVDPSASESLPAAATTQSEWEYARDSSEVARQGIQGEVFVYGRIDPAVDPDGPSFVCTEGGDSKPFTCLGPSLIIEGLSQGKAWELAELYSNQVALRGNVAGNVLRLTEVVYGNFLPPEDRPRTDEAMALPSHDSNEVPDALMVGRVSGDREVGCVWLLDEGGDRLAALWPSGWQARFEPLRIYDSLGVEVAREGRLLHVGGGLSPVDVDRIPPECRVGDQAWWVGSVQTAE